MADAKPVKDTVKQKAIKALQETLAEQPPGPLRDYVLSCLERVHVTSMVDATSGNKLSPPQTHAALANAIKENKQLYVILERGSISRLEPGKQNRARCALIQADSSQRIKTVFPTDKAAKDISAACIYCTYSQVFFPKGNNGANAHAIATCKNSLFETRKKIPGNENAIRDTTTDPILAAAGAVAQLAETAAPIGEEVGLLDAPEEDPLAGTGAGSDNLVFQAIENIALEANSDSDVEELKKRLREAEAVVSEIQKQLEKVEATKRSRYMLGDSAVLEDVDGDDAFNTF